MGSLFYILLSFVSSIIEAVIDGKRSKKGKKIEHGISATVRVAISAFVAFYWYEDVALPQTIIQESVFFVILLMTYWIPFDPVFNISREGWEKWRYIGTTAWTDKMARKIVGKDGLGYLLVKFLITFLLICIYSIL